jgi:endoglycosylceramidase
MRSGRNRWRAPAALLVLVLAALTYPGSVLVSMIVRLTPPPLASGPVPTGALPWLHVEHPQGGMPYIADDQGRLVLLHGAIPGGLIDFWYGGNPSRPDPPPLYPIDPGAYQGTSCPANTAFMPVPPLCPDDIVKMAALGFNSLRLPLSWSLLEPARGQFSQTYVERIAQVVAWAREQGMYVILDMHQNAYSRYVGAPADGTANLRYYTGAPAWATITDGFPSRAYLNQREINPAVMEADTNFWYDRNGIQDEYIATVAFLAQRFKGDTTVAGYSIFNEPWPGWNLSPGFEDLLLFPFYRRVIDAVTGVGDGAPCWSGFFMPAVCGYRDLGVHDRRHLFFLDTGLLREVTDFPTHLGLPVSSYPNLVLSMHAYTHIYTFDALAKEKPDQANYPWGGYDQGYSLAEREAKAMGAALFVAEFGNSPDWDSLILANQLLEQERHRVGFAFWTWMENCGSGSWGMYNGIDCRDGSAQAASSGCLRAARERLLSRVYPRASADPNLSYHYDASRGGFSMQASGRSGQAPTIVYVPRSVPGDVATSGAASQSVTKADDGSRLVTVTPSGGAFSTTVTSALLTLTGCP